MADYLYLLGDCVTGEILGELPFTPTDRYTRLLCGAGSFSGTIPLDDDMATKANFKNRLPNLIVVRNGIVRWFGPVTAPTPDLAARTLTLNAREPMWWMQHRCLEDTKHYHADTQYIFRKLWDYGTTKTDATIGDINAGLAGISVSSGNSGNTKKLPLYGPACYWIADIIHDFLVDDPDEGLEYRHDYSGGVDDPQCVITLGSPLGATLTDLMTEHSLTGYGLAPDFERALTRAHAVGAGSTSTKQNSGSVTDGFPLLDGVLDRSNTSIADALDAAAREYRRKGQPPVTVPDAEFTPTAGGLSFGFCNLGDKAPFDTRSPNLLSISAENRRVVEIGVMPETDDQPETVGLTFNLPLEDTGA